jgi:succinate dehydrogenase / fumarate reductase flavoprotein subunit
MNDAAIDEIAKWAVSPFERGTNKKGENPFQLQSGLQEMMQDLVGIARTAKELEEAIKRITEFQEQAKNVGCDGNRGYNPGWHTAIELHHMLTIAEAIARAANERKESRGGHFREDFTEKSNEFAQFNFNIRRDDSGRMMIGKIEKTKLRDDLQQIIDEMK